MDEVKHDPHNEQKQDKAVELSACSDDSGSDTLSGSLGSRGSRGGDKDPVHGNGKQATVPRVPRIKFGHAAEAVVAASLLQVPASPGGAATSVSRASLSGASPRQDGAMRTLQSLVNLVSDARQSRGSKRRSVPWWDVVKSQIDEGSREYLALRVFARDFCISERERTVGVCSSFVTLCSITVAVFGLVSPNAAKDVALSVLTLIDCALTTMLYHCRFRRDHLWRADHAELYPLFIISPRFHQMILRWIFFSVHAPWFLVDAYGPSLRVLNVFVLLRIGRILRTLSDHARVARSSAASLTAALSAEEISPLFTYKTMLFKHPVWTMSCSLLCGFAVLSVAVWLAEGNEHVGGAQQFTLADSLWYTMVTFTTVGYGDLVPGSVFGRLVGVLSALFGTVAGAVLTSVAQNKLKLSRIQKQMIMFLAEVEHGQRIKNTAARLVASALAYAGERGRAAAVCGEGALPEHRAAVDVSVCSAGPRRRLHRAWSKLLDAVGEFRTLRSGRDALGWADISVLDVLHADSSDLLAQNTVLQYLMRPADEELSTLLRHNRGRRTRARERRPGGDEGSLGSGGGTENNSETRSAVSGQRLSIAASWRQSVGGASRRPSTAADSARRYSQGTLGCTLPDPELRSRVVDLPQVQPLQVRSQCSSPRVSESGISVASSHQYMPRTPSRRVHELKAMISSPDHPPCPPGFGEGQPVTSPGGTVLTPSHLPDMQVPSPLSSSHLRPTDARGTGMGPKKGSLLVEQRRQRILTDTLQDLLQRQDEALARQDEQWRQLISVARFAGVPPEKLPRDDASSRAHRMSVASAAVHAACSLRRGTATSQKLPKLGRAGSMGGTNRMKQEHDPPPLPGSPLHD